MPQAMLSGADTTDHDTARRAGPTITQSFTRCRFLFASVLPRCLFNAFRHQTPASRRHRVPGRKRNTIRFTAAAKHHIVEDASSPEERPLYMPENHFSVGNRPASDARMLRQRPFATPHVAIFPAARHSRDMSSKKIYVLSCLRHSAHYESWECHSTEKRHEVLADRYSICT